MLRKYGFPSIHPSSLSLFPLKLKQLLLYTVCVILLIGWFRLYFIVCLYINDCYPILKRIQPKVVMYFGGGVPKLVKIEMLCES